MATLANSHQNTIVKLAEYIPSLKPTVLQYCIKKLTMEGAPMALLLCVEHVEKQKGPNTALKVCQLCLRLIRGEIQNFSKINSYIDSRLFVEMASSSHKKRDPGGNNFEAWIVEQFENEVTTYGDSFLLRALAEERDLPGDDPSILKYADARMRYHVDERHGSYQSRDKVFDLGAAPDVLIEFKRIVETYSQRFFLSSGTLLGIVRQNGFISSDYDIDVGMFSSEINHEECAEMFQGTSFDVKEKNINIVNLRHRDTGIDFDIFLYHEDEGMLYHGSDIHKWWTRQFDLKPWDFNGESFNVPENPKKLLEDLYGNWQKQVVFYDLSYDCPYRSYNNNFDGIVLRLHQIRKSVAPGMEVLC